MGGKVAYLTMEIGGGDETRVECEDSESGGAKLEDHVAVSSDHHTPR